MAKKNSSKKSKQELRDEITNLIIEKNEMKSQLLKARAEIANTSKRLTSYYENRMKTAGFNIAQDLLPSIDSIQMVIKTIQEKEGSPDDVINEGIVLIGQELEKLLETHKITRIEALHKVFNPTLHRAMVQDYESDEPEGIVTQELQKGYRMADYVLRHSQVAVSAKKEEISENKVAGDEDSKPYNISMETNQ